MSSTSARTLKLLGLLQTHRFWPGTELADRLGVSARTVRRDVDQLRRLGYVVDSVPGAAGGYQLVAGGQMPMLALDPDEALALVVGLTAAVNSGVADLTEPSVSALTKVLQILPSELRQRSEALRAVTVAPRLSEHQSRVPAAVLGTVAQACRDAVRLRFGYTARTGAASDRSVEPYRLVNLGTRWYLLAYDMDRTDWRTFRVDRMTDPAPARNTFTPRALPTDDVVGFIRAGIDASFPLHDVVVEFAAAAEEIAGATGRWATVEPLGPGRCRMSMATDSLLWPLQVLAAIDAEFDVVAPPELARLVRVTARRLARSGR
ncbi:MAG: YafY family protein [Acidimicrobiales bacterium]